MKDMPMVKFLVIIVFDFPSDYVAGTRCKQNTGYSNTVIARVQEPGF